MLAELDALRAEGYRFVAFSEERGEIDFGDPGVRVIIDPIDGSLNAKRGIPHHALSVAVADGADDGRRRVRVRPRLRPSRGMVGTARQGAWLNDERLDPELGERRGADGRLEVLGIEAADPRWVAASIDALGTALIGCARSARSPRRCARSRPPASTEW